MKREMIEDALIQPTILLVEPDDKVRPSLMDNLHSWGYTLIVALSETDAMQRVQGKGEPFDLLLMNQVGHSVAELVAIGRDICQHAGLPPSIPVVVMAECYGDDLEGQDVQMGDYEYVAYLEDGQQLKELLYLLCPVP
ncbi:MULTISPECIES: hypothetical protein [unclassified Leptolyngbya]|uniref:hypothetical protein n=1 Tax=unclassified Leptolyngbya TaxID=2650499 RepID=UPI0016856505|nr:MULTISPECIES: hypothetical protein [unclassified Leptolyngbya]MBD1909159.1 hypothetical protein [Leptolyngbya sp. FACHB-8]MBD2158461.1 hypothetical protein [Leptolyngbya sp. FACHB-16]